jgi:PAS domain S-box-containing protein
MTNDNTPKTILLVEDEAIISIVITKTLKRFGYNVLTAGSGGKAVELSLSNDAIDLILMDIDLGSGIDGTEAAKQILEFREIPIVFHTSHSEREMVDRVRGITRYGYVIKSSGDFVLQSSIEMAFELVEAHKKIKESEEHFYTMFDRAPLGYQSLDENGCFLEINQKWVETLGYSREDVVGRWFGDFLAPEFVDAFRERFPLFKAEGKIHSEFQMIHKNGSRRYIAFEGRVGYQDDGSFKQTHCILSDDTERKKTEKALMESEAFIKAVMDNLPIGIAVNSVNPEVKFSYMNDNFPELYRTTREAISDPDTFWSAVYEDPEIRERMKKRVLDDCASGAPERMHWEDIPITRSYGDTVYIAAMNVPLSDKELMISLVWDVTERNLVQRELKAKNEELASLNEELNAALEEMEATNEELSTTLEEMEAANEELYATNERLTESEREIERSEEKFRQMFFQHHAVMLLIDPLSGCIVDANYSAELFYGYDLDKLRRMKIHDINILSPEEIAAEMQHAKENQRTHFIFPHRLANSEIRTVEVYSSPVTINENKLLFSIIHDITERDEMERKLRESIEQFRSLAESSTDYIMVYDKEKRHIYANDATLKVSNTTWDEYVGKTHREMGYDPAQCELWEEKIQKVFDTGESQMEIFEWEGAEGKVSLDWRVTPVFGKNGEVDKVLGVSRDISEIKCAEEKFRISEERYAAALKAVDDGIWEWNVINGEAYFNPQYYNLLGYMDNEFPANYNSWRVLIHPEDMDRVETDLKLSIGTGIKYSIDLRMKMKSGEWLWVCIRGKAIETDPEGKVLRMVGTLSDVTLRKKTEFELRESQDSLDRIIKNSSELICEIDEHGKYTFVSERYKDVLGYSPDELLGIGTIEHMHPDEIETAKLKYKSQKDNIGLSVDEWRFRHKNGNYHVFECRSSVYIDKDSRPRMVVISHDITESKQIENTQLFLVMEGSGSTENEDFFNSLAKYLAETLKMDFVCIDKLTGGGLSARTVAVYFDGEFEDNIEYTLKDTPCGEVAGKTICKFEENVRGLFPDDLVLQEMKAESYAGVTLWGSTGEPIGLIAVIGREKMDNPRLAEKILKMVAIRAAGELERRDAEEKIRSLLLEKEILLKEVHHRIKNNMNTIHSLLALQIESLTDPAAADALGDAQNRVNSMMVLYDKLYRSDNFNEVSINEYLPELITEITGNFPNCKKVQIESRIDDFILEAQTLVPVGIIVNELITNTMKYAFTGRDSGFIKISAELRESKAVLTIEDNGVGIPATVTFENSSGFGMQLVGMLTEQIGGSIRIERGEGTRFVLEFTV